jgi:hypothetical protein
MLFGDELQAIYEQNDSDLPIKICRQLAELGNLTEGLAWVCLTGSSEYLDVLAHRRYHSIDMKQLLQVFPLADKLVSLNKQTYKVVRIHEDDQTCSRKAETTNGICV